MEIEIIGLGLEKTTGASGLTFGARDRALNRTMHTSDCMRAIREARNSGFAVIRPGVYLQSRMDIMQDRLLFNDNDPARNINYNRAAYWVTTDNGGLPIGVDGIAELITVTMP